MPASVSESGAQRPLQLLSRVRGRRAAAGPTPRVPLCRARDAYVWVVQCAVSRALVQPLSVTPPVLQPYAVLEAPITAPITPVSPTLKRQR